jgi:hypothetical protein
MFYFILIIFLGFFINFNYIPYDETLLLNFCFFVFFSLLYVSFKRQFKIFHILKILKKFTMLLMLFKINFNCNKLLKFFLIIIKKKFNDLFMKFKFLKYYISNILLYLFNKYNSLINILFLFFSFNMNHLKKNFILYHSYILNKIKFNDDLLCN